MKTYEVNLLAEKIIKKLIDSGNEINNVGKMTIKHLLETDFRGDETFYIPDCAWRKNPPLLVVSSVFTTADSQGYGNSRDLEKPKTLEEAIELKSKLRNKGDGYDDYWNNQDSIINRITTINQVVAIIKAEDKK